LARYSLKTKFILLTLSVCLLCLSVFLLISYYNTYKIVKTESSAKLKQQVLKNASEMNHILDEQATILNVITGTIESGNNYDEGYLLGYLTQMLNQQDSMVIDYYLGFVDPSRKFIDGSGWVPPADWSRYTRKWYLGAMAHKSLIFTAPYLDASTGSMIVTISEPVWQDHKIVAVAAADIKISNLINITHQVKDQNIDYAFLIDHEGNFLVHPDPGLQPTATRLTNAREALGGLYKPLLNSTRQANRFIELKDYDGRDRYFILSQIRSSKWIFGVAISKQVFNQPLQKTLGGFVIALFLAVITVLFLIGWAVDRFIKPVKTLQKAVTRFTDKDFAARVEIHSKDEIGELGSCFNTMAATIEEYNRDLEGLVAQRTRELEERNQRIMESIDYASRIQQSILPDLNEYAWLGRDNHFVIWKPRDVVGGDLYWSKQVEQDCFIAIFDCTGHGIPGALMTMTVNALLHRIIDEIESTDPARILGVLNRLLQATLHQHQADAITNDGVDIGLCRISPGDKQLVFAGARTSLFYSYQGEITEIKGNRQSLGYKESKLDYVFDNQVIELEKKRIFYMTTDGFLDQNGGNKNFGFGRKRFKEMLFEKHHLPLPDQKNAFVEILNSYMGSVSQRDDISFIGFQVWTE